MIDSNDFTNLIKEIQETWARAGIHAVIADQKHPKGIWTESHDEKDYEKRLLTQIYQEIEEYGKGEPKGFELKRIPAVRFRRSRKTREK